jgi:hypothetical protein
MGSSIDTLILWWDSSMQNGTPELQEATSLFPIALQLEYKLANPGALLTSATHSTPQVFWLTRLDSLNNEIQVFRHHPWLAPQTPTGLSTTL